MIDHARSLMDKLTLAVHAPKVFSIKRMNMFVWPLHQSLQYLYHLRNISPGSRLSRFLASGKAIPYSDIECSEGADVRWVRWVRLGDDPAQDYFKINGSDVKWDKGGSIGDADEMQSTPAANAVWVIISTVLEWGKCCWYWEQGGREIEVLVAFGWVAWFLYVVMYYPPLACSLYQVTSTPRILLLVIVVNLHIGSTTDLAHNVNKIARQKDSVRWCWKPRSMEKRPWISSVRIFKWKSCSSVCQL